MGPLGVPIRAGRPERDAAPRIDWHLSPYCGNARCFATLSLRRRLMADLLDRITINPNQCGGRPCIRDMRIRVTDVLDLLAGGQNPNEILEAYPYLEADDIATCLQYAARHLNHPTLAA